MADSTSPAFGPLRDLISETAADLSQENVFWTAACLAEALIKAGIAEVVAACATNPPAASDAIPPASAPNVLPSEAGQRDHFANAGKMVVEDDDIGGVIDG